MCQVLKVSSSAYYKWTKGIVSKRQARRENLAIKIHKIYEDKKGRYGSPRICKELNMQGTKVSKVLVSKIMKDEGLQSIVKKKFVATTDSKHSYPVAENLLDRNFLVEQCNKVWVSDITYIRTLQGWLYLTVVIDLYRRKAIGWAVGETLKTSDTTLPALEMAIQNSPIKNKKLIFHSDRGVQYACDDFRTFLKEYDITQSMSRKGDCWDNAVAESFFKTLKVELVYQQKYQTKQQAALSIFEYIEIFYNIKRRHKVLNNLTIFEHEQLFINHLKNNAA